MIELNFEQIEAVSGGDQAPSCETVTSTDSNGNTVTVTVCSCPAGTTPTTTTDGKDTSITCKTDS